MLFHGGNKMQIEKEFLKNLIEEKNPVKLIGEELTRLWLLSAEETEDLSDYYEKGEDKLRNFEKFLNKSYFEFYNSLARSCINKDNIFDVYGKECCFILMDGMSLRESAFLYKNLEKNGFKIEHKFNYSSIPSETQNFREKIGTNKNFIQINNITNTKIPFDAKYVWSQFPDIMLDKIKMGHSVISSLQEMYKTMETIVFDLINQIEAKKIIISSDHGYIRTEAGNVFTVDNKSAREMLRNTFGGKRSARIDENNGMDNLIASKYVEEFDGYYVIKSLYSWPVKGKSSIYIHGGLSLMECFTPVIVIEKE